MSGTLEPTQNQSLVRFNSIDEVTDNNPTKFTNGVAKSEYVAGGYYAKDVNLILNRNNDALIAKFGDGIIDKMLRDPEIRKCDTVIKIGVLSDGVTFFPALSKPAPIKKLKDGEVETPEQKKERLTREKDIERYELSEKYANFATRAIENLDTSFRGVIENMLDAITYGNKVAEQTYTEIFDTDFNSNLLTLSSIRVKSRTSTKFVVNKYKKLIGFRANIRNSKGELVDTILPREKFLVLTFRGKDGDPRGTSILESVYNAWYLKMQLWPEYLRWLLQCAIPSLVGYTAPQGEIKTYLKDVNGDLIRDANGNPVYEADVDSLLKALIQVRNSTAIALPNGAKVEPINNSVSGDPFKGMRDVLNEEIEMGMILQTLATSDSRHNTRAASQTHISILDALVFYVKEIVIDMIRNDLLKPLFKINFPNFDMTLLPKVSMGDSERRDWATDVMAIATLFKSGFIGESQMIGYDKIINAPDRDIDSDRIVASEKLLNKNTTNSSVNEPDNNKNSEKVNARAIELFEEYKKLHGEI